LTPTCSRIAVVKDSAACLPSSFSPILEGRISYSP
jgi:hypothetical protein